MEMRWAVEPGLGGCRRRPAGAGTRSVGSAGVVGQRFSLGGAGLSATTAGARSGAPAPPTCLMSIPRVAGTRACEASRPGSFSSWPTNWRATSPTFAGRDAGMGHLDDRRAPQATPPRAMTRIRVPAGSAGESSARPVRGASANGTAGPGRMPRTHRADGPGASPRAAGPGVPGGGPATSAGATCYTTLDAAAATGRLRTAAADTSSLPIPRRFTPTPSARPRSCVKYRMGTAKVVP